MISSYIIGVQNMAKGIQIMAGDTKCGSPLAIFCIPTHFVGDTLSGATPATTVAMATLLRCFSS